MPASLDNIRMRTMRESDPRATRPSLLLRLRDAADSAAWDEFAALYGPIIRGYCRRRGLQAADADDVGQEVLARVARAIGGFHYQPDRGRFRDWFGAVTRNQITRFVEGRGRQARATGHDEAADLLDDSAEDPEWSAEFHARILEAALGRIRGDFEPNTWDAFARVWGDSRPAPEVARELGLTIDAVYAAKSRVLRRLRDEVLMLAEDMPLIAGRG
jgi:RNA polymerase sigma-70 factor (ECF subfamily)